MNCCVDMQCLNLQPFGAVTWCMQPFGLCCYPGRQRGDLLPSHACPLVPSWTWAAPAWKHQAAGSTARRSKSQKVKLKLMSDLGFQPGAFVPSWRPLLGAVHWRELVSHHEIHLTPWHQLGPGSKPSLPCPPDQQASLGAAQCARAPRFRWIAANSAVLVTEVTEGQKWCNNT